MRYLHACLVLILTLLAALLPAAGNAQQGIPRQVAAEPATERPNKLLRSGYVGGPARVVAASGAYAYAGFGPALMVLRVDDAAHPTREGYLVLSAIVVDIVLDGQIAYVATQDNRLHVVSVVNPSAPVETDSYTTPEQIHHLAVANGLVYLATDYGLRIVDFARPIGQRELGALHSDTLLSGFAIAVSGHYAYLGGVYSNVLNIVDISDPRAPRKIKQFDLPGQISDIAVRGSVVYIVAEVYGGVYSSGKLFIVDVAEPTAPAIRGSTEIGGFGVQPVIFIAGNFAYAATYTGMLSVVDITDPTKPATIKVVGDGVHDVAVADGRIYLAAGSFGLTIYSATRPQGAAPLGSYSSAFGRALDVAAADGYVYAADGGMGQYASDWGRGGLRMLAASAPEAAQMVAWSGAGRGVAVVDGHVYLTSGSCFLRYTVCSAGIGVFDRREPDAPLGRGVMNVEADRDGYGMPGHTAVRDTLAFVAAGRKGMYIVDAADPQTPRLVSTYMPSPYSDVRSVAVTDTYALVANAAIFLDGSPLRLLSGGLRIVDVSDPAQPVEISAVMTDSHILDVAVRGRYAYLAEKNGLVVVDISQPAQPVVVSFLLLKTPPNPDILLEPDSANRIAVDGDYAYITAGTAGLQLVDISDPVRPVVVDRFDTPDYAVGVAVAGKRIYVADTYGGLFIFELGRPQAYLPMIAH